MRTDDAIPLEAFLPRIENPTLDDLMDKETLARLGRQTRDDWNRGAMIQVRALLSSGWKYEIPRPDLDPWQWSWRAPPKRAGSLGRKYLSTNQAFNAMQRAREEA